MRNLTEGEQAELATRCICCKRPDFFIGPQGGLSFNIYCAHCLAGFCVTHKAMPWQLISLPGDRTLEELEPILQSMRVVSATLLHSELSATIEKALDASFQRVMHGKPG